ncbi:hypothetical protein L2750_18695 [Shewanella submarina]|uniref:Uncharacterized protein n=1 Tax=Shewanella submarina TaxID=2016376 RepID=A0ABV7GGM7_9GAMM|nr:hypothetical protein [Shewanella submarina]MCL1039155.1 hypothetical protein [Shewanella submarina]
MNGSLDQLLSLVSHGNAFLNGQALDNYFPDDMNFRFCESVRFMELERCNKDWKEWEHSPDPLLWFKKMNEEGARCFRARYLQGQDENMPDHMSVIYTGGGGRWLIEVVKPEGSDFWEANWETGNRDDPQQKIWRVKYGRILKQVHRLEQPLPDEDQLTISFRQVLTDIKALADKHNEKGFSNCFNQALKCLDGDLPRQYKTTKLDKSNMSKVSQNLMAAARSAWVFGGMGSWNDMYFAHEAEYEALTGTLYQHIVTAFLIGVNPK